jgi:4-aminobutyrate aminotransferase-like enzyme
MIQHRLVYCTPFVEWAFDLDRAQGSTLWTKDGHKLIDFTAGWNTTNLGWNNAEVAEAMIAQVRKNSYAAMWMAEDAQCEYAAILAAALPPGLTAVGRATGGTEANEMALKAARAFTGRKQIVGFQMTYHGQSAETLQIGFPTPYIQEAVALGADFVQLPYPQIYRAAQSPEQLLQAFSEQLERVLSARQVAAVITEAGIVTGWGSVDIAPPGYLQVVRTLTQKYGSLMILDEVGTGFSRCGRLFATQLVNADSVTPDIITFAKAITNGGAAMGALVTTDEIGQVAADKGLFVSTFGWMPVACAAALQTLRIHQRDKVWEKARADGEYVMQRLEHALSEHPCVGDIRGKGLEIGIDFVEDKTAKQRNLVFKSKVIQRAYDAGLHLTGGNETGLAWTKGWIS